MSSMRKDAERSVSSLLKKRGGRVHMVGVCGVGMAGLAFLLKTRGFKVSGCDERVNRLADWLRENGIDVKEGHDPEHVIAGVDWVVRTRAVADDRAEVVKAGEAGIPVFFRGEVLPELLAGQTSVAICGTHGKTTTLPSF